MDRSEDRSEIVFFDVETIYSTSVIVEFGAILVCPKTLTELRQPFSTLVRPVNPSLIPAVFNRSNGITRDALAGAPTFTAVYELLHERVWAGHNILRFDCVHIREAFSEINRPPPEPRATIDSLPLLTQTFGRRAGDMKMASLATYFGLGQQRHRSLDDVRMNLEVIKYCATIMFLESSFPDILKMNSWVSANTTARNGSNGISLPDRGLSDMKMKSILLPPVPDQCMEGKRPIYQIAMCGSKVSESNAVYANESCLPDVFIVDGWVSPSVATTSRSMGKSLRDAGLPDMISPVADQCNEENPPTSPNIAVCNSEDSDELEIVDANLVQQQIFGFPLGEEIIKRELTKPPMSSPATLFEASSSATFVVLKPHEIPISSLTASLVQSYHGTLRIQLLHNNFPSQLSCADLKIRFGKNCVYNNAGRPKLSFGVYLSETLCEVLEACDAVALSLFLESGSSSGWRPLVTRKEGFFNYPTVRLH
ncbi:protein NEN3-like [Prosopis cineraria]|uniref:protein NEN3-like n=1 Tax=Prosopis cineraria TaxID=364024 RepID=UPI00240F9F95|nr:protein NEN3-like [Prosopis cineraria]